MDISPIVLFTYNRPQHTQKTLEALSRNHLADQSTLYIYCDGPKPDASEETIRNIEEVRTVVKSNQWCKEVKIIESNINKGLAKSIVSGVTEVVNAHTKVIVLEDDIMTAPGFLTFMNEALSLYEFQEKVMHISGFMYPIKYNFLLPENFFLYSMNCWGWATWKRAWDTVDFNFNQLKSKLLKTDLKNFDNINYNAWDQIDKNISGELKTWAIAWYSSIYLNEGLCLFPNKSLVKNIGYDNSGVHCGSNKLYQNQKITNNITVINPVLKVNNNIENIILYFRSNKNSKMKLFIGRVILLSRYLKTFAFKITTDIRKRPNTYL